LFALTFAYSAIFAAVVAVTACYDELLPMPLLLMLDVVLGA